MKKNIKNISLFLVFVLISILVFSCSSSPNAQIIEVDERDDIQTQIINLGLINSRENDYAFKQAHDGKHAYITSNRKQDRKQSLDDDLWEASKRNNEWNKIKNIGSSLNIAGVIDDDLIGDGSCAISFDGNTLYFVSSRAGGFGNADIYTATPDEDGDWENVKNIGAPINTKWFESHPSISPDNKTLYFVSDRQPGGYGGADIWYSELGDDGVWGEPRNMGPEVNTSGNESGPFIAADNSTLYFTSNGLPGYGKGTHDIFVVRKENEKWGKPKNLGPKVNSVYNDRFPYAPTSGLMLYFSSDRPGGRGGYDLYYAFPNPELPKRVPTISGIVVSSLDNQPMQVKIKVVELDSKESVEFESEKLTGKYFSVIPNGKRYEIFVEAEGYSPYSQVIEISDDSDVVEVVLNIVLLSNIRSDLNINVSHVLPSSEMIETDPMLVGFKGLLLKEVIVNELLPLLNYIFFDKESSQIPPRYKLFSSTNETEGFAEGDLSGGELIHYHHILNIVGSRMKVRPDVRITLAGCNDNLGRESGNTELSRTRANVTQEYLSSIWGIDKEHIKVIARNLPTKPSNQAIADGQAENRRVEILVDAGTLLEPTYIERSELYVAPEKVYFNINTVSEKPIRGWTLTITQDGKVLKRFTGDNGDMSIVTWNWLDTNNQLPQNDKPIVYRGIVYTTDGDTAFSNFSQIPVNKIILTPEEDQTVGRVFEKMTLILYDFNQSNLSPQNMEILRMVFPKITPDASVSVNGHTDNIGTDVANLNLSTERARIVHNTLKENKRARSYKYKGLGKNTPLYNNLLPEGRFYNRTVQVIIERDIRE
jgi:outer membrane protein OmpA-like peptidoglycan-associated protein